MKGYIMKRLVPVCVLLIGALLFTVACQDTFAAPKVLLKVVGKSMNQRPTGAAYEYTAGLLVSGKGSKVYLLADTTGSADSVVTTWTWVLTPAAGSSATLDSGLGHAATNSFTPDVIGSYTVQITADAGANGSKVSTATVFVSTYVGNQADPTAAPGCFCHVNGAVTGNVDYFKKWSKTPHATMMERGMKGQQEVDANVNKGLYAQTCTPCHGVAPEPAVNNGNYAYLAHTLPAASPNSWDSTWFKGLPYTADGRDVMITPGVDSIWNKMPAAIKPVATIGCENCHGPAADHKSTGAATAIAVERTSDACNVCHDGSKRHSLGGWWRNSLHNTGETFASEGGNGSCAKCHSGSGFIDWVKAGKPSGNLSVQPDYAQTPIGCPTCHDPHDTLNIAMAQLRTASVTLSNGFAPPGTKAGYLCMNCHQSRSAVSTYVKPNEPAAADGNKYYGFKGRFGPHHSNQGDMLFGQNGYEYGDPRLAGLNTHGGLEGACATCHMTARPTGSGNELPNHQWDMDTTKYANPGINPKFNPGTACESCHGVEEYGMIQAAWDYDNDGVVESAEKEVQGMLASLKAILPKDTTGEVIGSGSVTKSDSLKVANRLDYVAGIYNYWYVVEDRCSGMHNTKYAVQILGKALNLKWADINRDDFGVPETYTLSQNYPNPFNPTTTIHFSIANPTDVRIDVYDMIGQHVTSLINTQMSAGKYNITWNGQDKNGSRVASGMYLYRMVAGNFTMTKKMLMIK
jgi:FlgD Ig-like domain